ncbi:ACT domain-containing protein [Adlercreutzia sp. ZJ154]|uniref:ACT domain-containing protein n=1 Tax=Adlercreutzia sp. ZJ154 TaxID=2709790 RepID=UPI0013EAB3FD|nr:ACT domain-containing protein [Adlercreutzia sp. ZJ154]
MTVSQISVFAQSKPGHLARVLNVFEAAGANVRGFAVSDTGEFGITRFILDRPDIACDALKREGFAYIETQVLCLKLEDRPGELARVISLLAERNENVLYSYSMISTYIILATDNIEETKEILKNAGLRIITQADIEKANAIHAGNED